jgi:transposase-like protein
VAYKWYSEEVKRQALALYLEGLGFRSIGRLLNCSHVAVYQWIKQYGEQASLEALPTTELDVVEMDEMHSYIGSKKNLVGYGLPLTEQESDSSTW